MPTTAYCTAALVELELSASGVALRVTDDAAATADCIQAASREIDEYCLLGYSTENLAASEWVKYKCRQIAAFLLCERVGENAPASLARKYDKAIKTLEKIQLGQVAIPDIAARASMAPVLSNVHVQNWPVPHTRVGAARSTGTATGYDQKRDLIDPLDYTI